MASSNDVLFLFGHDMNLVLDLIESDQNIQSGFQEARKLNEKKLMKDLW